MGLAVIVSVSCSTSELARHSDARRAGFDRGQNCLENRTAGSLGKGTESQVSFEDTTKDVVTSAQKVIETNLREGAVLDQRWYGLKYFGKHQERIFNATKVIFFGGLEDDVRKQVAGRYVSIDPAEKNRIPAIFDCIKVSSAMALMTSSLSGRTAEKWR